MGVEKSEFHADFRFEEIILNNLTGKKLTQKTEFLRTEFL
jgi:hypothetical protein